MNIKDGIIKVVSVICLGLGFYSGIDMLIPAVLAIGCGYLLEKVIKKDSPMTLSFSIQTGHILWILGSGIMLGSTGTITSAIVLASLVAWLLLKPGKLPVWILTIINTLLALLNLSMLRLFPIGSLEHKSVTVHAFLRIIAIFFMFIELKRMNAISLEETIESD